MLVKHGHWKREVVAWGRRRCNTTDVNVVVETVMSQSKMVFLKRSVSLNKSFSLMKGCEHLENLLNKS